MRWRSRRRSELTSLVDVLFILLFASLVQQRRADGAGEDADTTPADEVAAEAIPADAGPPAPPPTADPHESTRELVDRLEATEAILVSVDADGVLTSIERNGDVIAIDLPLLSPTADSRVVTYAADLDPGARLCTVVAESIAKRDLGRALILIGTTLPLRDLPYALVRGLRADAARCLDDAGAYALLVRPAPSPSEPAP